MSGYVTSNCFKKLASKKMLIIFSAAKMSTFSKIFYSIRNANRFLITPIFVRQLWSECYTYKFANIYNINFVYFILGALGDLFNIFFCLG